jgi:hypothetical protein
MQIETNLTREHRSVTGKLRPLWLCYQVYSTGRSTGVDPSCALVNSVVRARKSVWPSVRE